MPVTGISDPTKFAQAKAEIMKMKPKVDDFTVDDPTATWTDEQKEHFFISRPKVGAPHVRAHASRLETPKTKIKRIRPTVEFTDEFKDVSYRKKYIEDNWSPEQQKEFHIILVKDKLTVSKKRAPVVHKITFDDVVKTIKSMDSATKEKLMKLIE